MFFTRKIGSVLRGKATRGQVLLATMLGGLLGFVPGFFLPGDLGGGFRQAPGLILSLLFLVLILNANLGVFGVTLLLAKITSLLTLPLAGAMGGFLLDGPTQGLFRMLINAPVTAWFGFEYYATTGGLPLGLLFGLLMGFGLNAMLRAIRTHMAGVEENSERYQKYANKRWVKLCTWLFLGGGKGKQTWKELSETTKFGLPIRISGVILVVVLGASLYVFQQWFSTPILTRNLRAGLVAANGATVDLEAARLDLADGTVKLQRLAVADAKALDRDLLAADELVARIDTRELLRKRLVIDEITSDNARAGTRRSTPGVVIPGDEPPPPPPPPPAAGSKTIDDYLKDVEVWKARLEQARQWIEKLTGGEATPAEQQTPEQRQAELDEQARLKGLASVVANHLLEGSPRVLIRKIDIKGLGYVIDGVEEKLDLVGRNLSTDPSLLEAAATFAVQSQSDKLKLGLAAPGKGGGKVGLDFAWRRLPVDSVFGQLKLAGASPLKGGTMDLVSNGSLSFAKGVGAVLDLPLNVALKETTFAFAGMKETRVESLALPVGVRGAVTQPSVHLDDKALQDAFVAAGQKELASFVQGQAGKLLGGVVPGVEGLLDPSKAPTQVIDEAKKKAEEEAERLKQEAAKKAAEEAKKLIPGGLQGLLPGGGKKN
ncbi:MAG: hypothetical protein IPK26_18675 [Planctomycetes bacterium]|nr:hypothetical protein [Planctomycetota bacterium]